MEYFQFSFNNLLPQQQNGAMERGECPYCYLLFLLSSYLEALKSIGLTSFRGANNKTKRNFSPKDANSSMIRAHVLYALKFLFLFPAF